MVRQISCIFYRLSSASKRRTQTDREWASFLFHDRWWRIIPPLEEQNQIYQYLLESCQNVDSISVNLRKTIEELDEYPSSLISAAVTGKLNITEVTHGK